MAKWKNCLTAFKSVFKFYYVCCRNSDLRSWRCRSSRILRPESTVRGEMLNTVEKMIKRAIWSDKGGGLGWWRGSLGWSLWWWSQTFWRRLETTFVWAKTEYWTNKEGFIVVKLNINSVFSTGRPGQRKVRPGPAENTATKRVLLALNGQYLTRSSIIGVIR